LTTTLLLAFGLMLVLEGVLPLVAPQAWKETFKRMIELKDGQLRFVGIFSMTVGIIIMFIAK
jgi:uncharacterized protein